MTRRQLIALIVTAVALAAAVTAAWAIDYFARQEVEPYRVEIVQGGKAVREFSLDELKGLGTRNVVMDGELQAGPALLSVLKASGIESFDSVTVIGMGLRDSGRIELGSGDIDEDVLLDFAVRGTTKLCGPEIAWDDRVRDVERIEVR